MFILQVPPTSIIHKMKKEKKKTFSGQTLYRTLCLHIYGGGNIYIDRDMEKQGSSAHFPRRTGCTPWFFRMLAGIKLNCTFNNGVPNRRRKKIYGKFVFFKGYISTSGISAILVINALKWRRSAGNGNSQVVQRRHL